MAHSFASRLPSLGFSLSDPLRSIRDSGHSLIRFTILVVRSLAISLATLVVRFATLVARSEVSRLPSFAHSADLIAKMIDRYIFVKGSCELDKGTASLLADYDNILRVILFARTRPLRIAFPIWPNLH